MARAVLLRVPSSGPDTIVRSLAGTNTLPIVLPTHDDVLGARARRGVGGGLWQCGYRSVVRHVSLRPRRIEHDGNGRIKVHAVPRRDAPNKTLGDGILEEEASATITVRSCSVAFLQQ